MPDDRNPLTTAQAWAVVSSSLGLVLLCGIVVATSAFGFAQMREKRYAAIATLHFDGRPPTTAQVDALATAKSPIPLAGLTNAEAVARPPVLAATAGALDMRPEALEGDLKFAEGPDLSRVEVTATSSSAATAAATVNAYARHYVEFQNRRNERLATAGLAKLQRLRDGASESTFAAYAKALRTISRGGYGGVTIAAEAGVPSSPSSPDLARDVLAGLAIGLLLGAALVLARESRATTVPTRRAPRIAGWDGRAADA